MGSGWFQFWEIVLELTLSTLRDVKAGDVQVLRARASDPTVAPSPKLGPGSLPACLWSACTWRRECLWALRDSIQILY